MFGAEIDIKILTTLFVVLLGLLIFIVAIYFLLSSGDHKPVDRKWTDPKFHD